MHRGALVLSCVLAAASCDSGSPLRAACQTSIQRGQSMLSVPDVGAARDWLAQARTQCGKDPPPALAQLEQAIAGVERAQAEAAERKRRELEPKPARESLVPRLIAVVTEYRDTKGRELCESDDEGRCAKIDFIDGQAVQLWTARGKAEAFLAFTTLPRELATCDELGPSQVKRTYADGAKVYCALTDGPLKGLFALVKQARSRPSTDVTIFSAKGIDADESLKAELTAITPE
jgi:hypothetical protein